MAKKWALPSGRSPARAAEAATCEDLDESGDHQVTVFTSLSNCLHGQLLDACIETGHNPIQLRSNGPRRRHINDVQHLLQVASLYVPVVLDRLQRVVRQHPINGREVLLPTFSHVIRNPREHKSRKGMKSLRQPLPLRQRRIAGQHLAFCARRSRSDIIRPRSVPHRQSASFLASVALLRSRHGRRVNAKPRF